MRDLIETGNWTMEEQHPAPPAESGASSPSDAGASASALATDEPNTSHPDPLTVPETRQPTGLPPLVNGALFCSFCGKGAQELRSGELWAGINPRYACICVDCARNVLETAASQLTVPETSRQGSSGADIAARVASDLAAGDATSQSEGGAA